MCDQCFQRFCPPSCPNHSEKSNGQEATYCLLCGERLNPGEGFYRIHGFPYCELCLDSVDIDELVRICEIPKREWLEHMGFSFDRAPEWEGF